MQLTLCYPSFMCSAPSGRRISWPSSSLSPSYFCCFSPTLIWNPFAQDNQACYPLFFNVPLSLFWSYEYQFFQTLLPHYVPQKVQFPLPSFCQLKISVFFPFSPEPLCCSPVWFMVMSGHLSNCVDGKLRKKARCPTESVVQYKDEKISLINCKKSENIQDAFAPYIVTSPSTIYSCFSNTTSRSPYHGFSQE